MRAVWNCVLILATVQCASADDWKPPASLDSLPPTSELPDLFLFADGEQVESPADWERRRTEMKAILQYYEYGHLPPRPDVVNVEDFESRELPDCNAIEQRMTLVMGAQSRLRMRIAVYRRQASDVCR
jgi:hypothetical protein